MKPILFYVLILCLAFSLPSALYAGDPTLKTDDLRKEISDVFQNRNLGFLDKEEVDVTVDFLINAQKELVLTSVSGDNAAACDYVRNILKYKQVKYKQAKQLTHYVVNIKLIKNGL